MRSDIFGLITRGVRAKIILRDGAGQRHNPHRYWLPEREQEWNANPLIRMAMENFERWKRERGGSDAEISLRRVLSVDQAIRSPNPLELCVKLAFRLQENNKGWQATAKSELREF